MASERILDCMAYLVGAYPNYDLKPETLKTYLDFLGGKRPEVVMAAVRRHIERNKWFPSVSELLEAVRAAEIELRQQAPAVMQDELLEMQRLEDIFYQEGLVASEDWMALIGRLEAAGRYQLLERANKRLQEFERAGEAVP